MLQLRQITKEYPMGKQTIKVLHGIDIDIQEGSYTAIMWPSWSGKSTLMNIIGMLDNCTTGTYEIDTTRVDNLSESKRGKIRRQKIGFVFQNYSLIPRLSVIEQVKLPLLYQWIGASESNQRAQAALEEVWLGDKWRNMPNELSGWQKQRVAVARALVIAPKLMLADEPTGALDTKTSTEIMELFDRLHKQGKTIIMITHEREIAERAERIVTLRDGLIVSDEKI